MQTLLALLTLLISTFFFNPLTAQEILSPSGVSHIVWPFPNSEYSTPTSGTNNWAVFCGHGCGAHFGGDYFADDWNLAGSADCGVERFSPISGTVIFVGIGLETGYGNQVIIQSSLNNSFAFRTAHLSEVLVTVGQSIKAGDLLGKIGTTGNSTGCHGHEVLYKNISNVYSGTETAISRLKKGLGLGFSGSTNQFAAEYLYDAKKASAVSSDWTVASADGLYNGVLNNFKLWKMTNAEFYSVTVKLLGLSSGAKWSMYIATESGLKAYDGTIYANDSKSQETFKFQIPSNFVYSADQKYKFRIVAGTDFNQVLTESPVFYLSDLPTIRVVSFSPNPVKVGTSGNLSWQVSGGITGLANGGWTGNVQVEWVQNGTVQSELVKTPVNSGSYSFSVPSSIPNCLIPGDFKLKLSNPSGSSMPIGMVSALSSSFKIESTVTANDSLQISSRLLNFGDVKVADSKGLSFTVKNPSSAVHPIRVYLSGTDFTSSHDGAAYNLQPGEIKTLTVYLFPLSVNAKNGNVRILDDIKKNISVQYDITLKGNGIAAAVGHLTANPDKIMITEKTGNERKQTVILTNSGMAALKGNVTVSAQGFSIVSASSVSISAGGSSDIALTFKSSIAGEFTGEIKIVHDGDNSPLIIPVSALVSDDNSPAAISEKFENGVPPAGWSYPNFNWSAKIGKTQGYNDSGLGFESTASGGNAMICRSLDDVKNFTVSIKFRVDSLFTSTKNIDFLILSPIVDYNDLQGSKWLLWATILPVSEGRLLVSGRDQNGSSYTIANIPFRKNAWNELTVNYVNSLGQISVNGQCESLFLPSLKSTFSDTYSSKTEAVRFILLGVNGDKNSNVTLDEFGLESGGTSTDLGRNQDIRHTEDFIVASAYPNPFNPETNLEFVLPSEQVISIKIFDVLGRQIENLVHETLYLKGKYSIPIRITSRASGKYFVLISSKSFSKVVLLTLLE